MKLFAAILCIVTGTTAYAFTNAPIGSINRRLDTLIIPACEFREAKAIDILEFIVSSAIYLCDAPTESIGIGGTAIDYPDIYDHSLPVLTNLPPVTINARRISVRDLLNYVTKSLNMRYSVTDTSILIYTTDGTLLNNNESVEQAVPGYPPQGVGSPEP